MEVERYKLFLVEFVITVTVGIPTNSALHTHACTTCYYLEECTISKLYVLKIYYTLYK